MKPKIFYFRGAMPFTKHGQQARWHVQMPPQGKFGSYGVVAGVTLEEAVRWLAENYPQ